MLVGRYEWPYANAQNAAKALSLFACISCWPKPSKSAFHVTAAGTGVGAGEVSVRRAKFHFRGGKPAHVRPARLLTVLWTVSAGSSRAHRK